MNTEQIIQIISASAGSASSLISQVAWFLAIGWAAKWLSFSFPLLMIFSVFMRVRKNMGTDTSKGTVALIGWVTLAISIYTGTRGMAHLIQAGMAPSVYLASESGILPDLLTNKGGMK